LIFGAAGASLMDDPGALAAAPEGGDYFCF
jgi:hypothetical protein